jgi:hypothetical protein
MIQILKRHMKHVKILCSETEVSGQEYLIQDGLLFKGFQLCIPKCSMRENLLKEKHSGGLAGHFGHDKTFAQLNNSYYWPGMREEVKKFVNRCNIFQYAKGKR